MIERAARATCLLSSFGVALAFAGCEDAAGPNNNLGGNPCRESSAEASASPVTAGSSITILGRGVTCERYTAEVAARGDYAYTTTWSTRGRNDGNAVKVWDVSGSPQLVDSLIIEDAATTGDVQISEDGRWLVVATEFQTGSIVAYDLEDPAHPRLVSRHMSDDTRDNGVHTVKLYRDDASGKLSAFLSVNDGTRPSRLVVVDLSDPANPREALVRAMGDPFIHDVFVRDGLLFTALWNGGMTIWDIGRAGRGGSPENPVAISNIKTVGSADRGSARVHNMWWFHNPQNGEKRYVFVGEEIPAVIGEYTGDVHVVDISDIDDPQEVAFYHVPGAGAHNFTMDEQSGILYAAFYSGGVRALDVRGDLGDCAAEHRAADGRCDLTLAGREAAVALGGSGDVSIWGVARVGDLLYASDMLSGIFKLDVSALAR